MKIVDLTQTFTASMPVYPGDQASELAPIATHEKEGCVNHRLGTSMHVGTHIDGPLHMIPQGKKLSEFPPEKFIGHGLVIDARGRMLLDDDLLKRVSIKKEEIILFYTGHDKRYREADYFKTFPVISEKLAHQLAASGPKMIGLDTPSPDCPPYNVHKILLNKEILIIENLTGLESLVGKSFEVIALPLKLDADSAPARVVARLT